MADNSSQQWNQLKDFLKKASDDMKKVGQELRTETTRLVDELRDPEKQAKAKEKLEEFGSWAKTTAQGAADLAETAMKKIEDRMATAGTAVSDVLGGSAKPSSAPKAAAKKPAPKKKKAAPKKAGPVKKTIGKKKSKKA